MVLNGILVVIAFLDGQIRIHGAEKSDLANPKPAGSFRVCHTVDSVEQHMPGLGPNGTRLPRVPEVATRA